MFGCLVWVRATPYHFSKAYYNKTIKTSKFYIYAYIDLIMSFWKVRSCNTLRAASYFGRVATAKGHKPGSNPVFRPCPWQALLVNFWWHEDANNHGLFGLRLSVFCAYKMVNDSVCCSVLQCVAVCCSVLQCFETTRWWMIQCVAVCCSVLQCVVATRWWMIRSDRNRWGFPRQKQGVDERCLQTLNTYLIRDSLYYQQESQRTFFIINKHPKKDRFSQNRQGVR